MECILVEEHKFGTHLVARAERSMVEAWSNLEEIRLDCFIRRRIDKLDVWLSGYRTIVLC
jgi:hypothetical protein